MSKSRAKGTGSSAVSSVSFFVPGAPVPKARPRVTRQGHAYTPARTVDWEDLVGWWAKIAMKGRPTFIGPLNVELGFQGARKNSDSDNLAKAVLDGMNRIVYDDDKQIQRLVIEREVDPAYTAGRKGVFVSVTELP